MSKITKKQLQESHNKLLNQFASLVRELKVNNVIDDSVCSTFTKKTEPKQLDRSVFDGAHEMWRFASVDADGAGFRFAERPELTDCFWRNVNCSRFDRLSQSGAYDAADWQNSLIERDIAKELLEVDLSSELTGSELCKAMLARGDGYVVCLVSNVADSHAIKNREHTTLIEQWVERDGFYNYRSQNWGHAVPANPATNEPLTASEAGF